ncbi:MAG: hypothetical protein OXD46_02340 [Chloroflexi bacterium]|nr:hypothetical protein [Chloroflexota bacterium]
MSTEQFDQLSARITVTEILVARLLKITYGENRDALMKAFEVVKELLEKQPDPDDPNLDPSERAIRKGVQSGLNSFKVRLHQQLYLRETSPDWTVDDVIADLSAFTHEPFDVQ